MAAYRLRIDYQDLCEDPGRCNERLSDFVSRFRGRACAVVRQWTDPMARCYRYEVSHDSSAWTGRP